MNPKRLLVLIGLMLLAPWIAGCPQPPPTQVPFQQPPLPPSVPILTPINFVAVPQDFVSVTGAGTISADVTAVPIYAPKAGPGLRVRANAKEQKKQDGYQRTLIAYLIDDDGNVIEAQAHTFPAPTPANPEVDNVACTFKFNLPAGKKCRIAVANMAMGFVSHTVTGHAHGKPDNDKNPYDPKDPG